MVLGARIAADAEVRCEAFLVLRQTEGVTESPPDRFMSPDERSGWYATRQDGSSWEDDVDEAWAPPPEGTTIRLMGDEDVDVPLWAGELMFNDAEELIAALEVSPELAADLVGWARRWHTRSGQPDHDAEAAALVRLLSRELGHRYHFVFKP